jgi:hypothetical protein
MFQLNLYVCRCILIIPSGEFLLLPSMLGTWGTSSPRLTFLTLWVLFKNEMDHHKLSNNSLRLYVVPVLTVQSNIF